MEPKVTPKERTLQFITSIHCSKSLLRALNSMTFIYNPMWDISKADAFTLPVAFFAVKSMSEIYTSEVSQKPMLFYNDGSSFDASASAGSILNVVADNIIIKPKQYRLDCIVPYTYIHPLMGTHYINPQQLLSMLEVSTSNVGSEGFSKTRNVINLMALSNPFLNVFNFIFRTLTLNVKDVESFFTSAFSSPDYNKASLEAMYKNRTILKMKTWEGWRYKYVVITNMEISKDGTEKDVYNASLTLQEVPILTLRSQFKSMKLFSGYRSLGKVVGKAISKFTKNTVVATLNYLEQKKRD